MISIIIPCHNEEAVLPQVFTRLAAVASTWRESYEVLLVDDGSTDGTWQQIQSCHRRDPRWKGLRLARNFGQQAAIGAGLWHARGAAVACLDADLQDPPELLAQFIERWRAGADVVYGIRTERPEGWLKRLCYRGFYWLLMKSAVVPVPADAGDFALLDRKVVRALLACREQHPFWRGLRAYVGFRQEGIVYSRHSRQAGSPQYSLRKLLKLADDGFWALSRLPLQVFLILALFAGLVGWVVALTGPTTLAVRSALLLGVVQVAGLALLARYAARILDEVRRRPRWLVAERLGIRPRRRRLRHQTQEWAGVAQVFQ